MSYLTLKNKIRTHCVKRGTFTLKSGAKTNVYLDLRVLTLSTDVWYLAQALDLTLEPSSYHAIGGPESGANQIIGAFQCYNRGAGSKRGFVVRKAEKGHGVEGMIVGTLLNEDRVTLVEDVTTSGESVLRAAEIVEAYGAHVVRIVSVVDREQGAAELFKNKGIAFDSLFKMGELI